MIYESLEKKINKLDNDIEALRRAKHYLSNKDEINEIMDNLNKERQVHADEIYLVDTMAYTECIDYIRNIMNKELGRDECEWIQYEDKEWAGLIITGIIPRVQ